MSYCLYDVDKKTRVATITFNRPEKLHALSYDDCDEVLARLTDAEHDDDVAAIIIKGSGRAFGGGFDIDHVRNDRGFDKNKKPTQRARMQEVKRWWGRDAILQRILTCDKMTIAQVHGYCFGGHFEIMTVCDLAIASEDALFTHPGYNYLGIEGHLPLYILMMGIRNVKEMMLLGERLTAQQAKDFGLINRIVPKDRLEEETRRIAEQVARHPIDGIVLGKNSFTLALDILGVGAGYTGAYITHSWLSNLHFEPGEFNLMKELRDGGRQGMYAARDKQYKGAESRPDKKIRPK